MTSLGCNAHSCAHNKDRQCCLSSIHVSGESASSTEDTSCRDFTKSSDNVSNSSTSPKISLNITCDAKQCIHNTDNKCNAEHVDIAGLCASDCCETSCSSFEES